MNILGLGSRHSLAVILTILIHVSPSQQFTHYVSDPDSCDIIGDSDIYGIGVRISYYLAFWSGIIALLANHKSAVRDCRKGLNIISSAVFITVVRNTVQGSFALFEWYIVFPMVFTPICSLLIFDAKEIVKELVSIGVWFVLNSIYSLLQPWIWWIKLHQGSRPECHSPKVLIYGWFDLYNHKYVTFGKVISIILCVCGVCSLIVGLGLIFAAGFNGDEIERSMNAFLQRVKAESPNSQHQEDGTLAGNNVLMAVLSAFSGITLIVFTELVLRRNRVDLSDAPLTSTSQLLPLLVGIFTFVSTVWSVFTDKKKVE